MASRSISERAARMLAKPKPPFSALYYEHLGKFYDPATRPEGLVNLSVAENRLASPMLQERLRRASNSGVSLSSLAYNPYTGSEPMREALARVLSRHVAKGAVPHENLFLTNGAGSALWFLATVLAEPGDGVLIPKPYYYAYDRDLTDLCDCQVIPFAAKEGEEDAYSLASLSAAADAAKASGVQPRLLVVTSPNNPTGAVVSPVKLKSVITWAQERGIHVIANEIYACSASTAFRSVLALYQNEAGDAELPSHVHFVWATSKDFAANGLRCGCIYTNAPEVQASARAFLYFFQVGGPIQEQLAECFTDDQWVDTFLIESRRALTQAVRSTTSLLDELGVPYIEPQGSLFVWADFSRWTDAAGGELELFKQLAALPGGGVLMCPGRTFHADRDGWFRICVTSAPAGHLEVALARLKSYLVEQSPARS